MDKYRDRILAGGMIILFLTIAFVSIGDTREFRPDDESLYVQIAKEMYEGRNFWIPTWCGEYAFYKPPLTYWISMTGFLLNGNSILSARIPVALLALATVLITYLLGHDLYGKKEGLIAAAITATSLGFVIFGKIVMMDIPLCFFMSLSVYFFHRASKDPRHIVAFFASGGISALIKGPISCVILILFAAGYCALTGKWKILSNRWTIPAILCALIGIIVWPAAVHAAGLFKEWYSFFIVRENLGKFHEEVSYPWYRIASYFLMYLFPWSVLVPAAAALIFRNRLYKKEELLFPLLWMLSIIFIYMIPATKLKHYAIPAIPPAALLCASLIDSNEKIMRVAKILLQLTFGIIFMAVIGLMRIMTAADNVFLLALSAALLLIACSAVKGKICLSAILYGLSLIFFLPALSSLTFDRLPHESLPLLQNQNTAVVCLQNYVYTHDLGRYVPQLDNAVDFNRFLYDKKGRIVISDTELEKFRNTKGFHIAPVEKLYSWKQWKNNIPLRLVTQALWKGDAGDLIEEMHIVKASDLNT